MSEQTEPDVGASTRFPFIKLEDALKRAKQLFDAAGEHETSVPAAFETWQYSDKSSGGNQTISALKMYGLLEDSGFSERRKLSLSNNGTRFFRDERESEIAALKQEFALNPPLFAVLWKKWGASPPADNIARSHLKIDLGMADQNARSALNIYKENIVFANLKSGAKLPEILAKDPQMHPQSILDRSPSDIKPPAAKSPMLQEIFYLDEGPVTLSFPSDLSPASYEELKDGLEFALRRAQRRSRQQESGSGEN